MKTLILIRHANALPAYEAGVKTDTERPLSEQGRQKAFHTAQLLAGKQPRPQIIFASPLVRAAQTAEILSQTLGAPVSQETVLNGLYDEKNVWDFLVQQLDQYDTVAAVGHNPNISYLTNLLCHEIYHFAPGSFAVLNVTDRQAPRLILFGE